MNESSLKLFKTKPLLSEAEMEARAKKALERQLADALALSSHPGGLKKRISPIRVENYKTPFE